MIAHSIGSPSRLLRMADVCETYSVHPNTIRAATNSGKLTCYKTCGNHRRFAESDVLAWLRQGPSEQEAAPTDVQRIALYARVSGRAQATGRGASTESDLDRQIQKLRDYAALHYPTAEVVLYKDIASGLSYERESLLRLVDDVLNKRFGVVIVTYRERLARFGVSLFEKLFSWGDCKLISCEGEAQTAKENDSSELAADIVACVTHFSARVHGQRAKKNLKVIIPAEVLTTCYKLKQSGLSYRAIAAKLKREGKGKDETGKPITRGVIRTSLIEHHDTLASLATNDIIDHNSFSEFFKARVSIGDDSLRLPSGELAAAYREWADRNNLPVLCRADIARWMKINNPAVATVNYSAKVIYCGLKLESPE